MLQYFSAQICRVQMAGRRAIVGGVGESVGSWSSCLALSLSHSLTAAAAAVGVNGFSVGGAGWDICVKFWDRCPRLLGHLCQR